MQWSDLDVKLKQITPNPLSCDEAETEQQREYI